VELAAAELAEDGRAQLLSGACGEHDCGYDGEWRVESDSIDGMAFAA